MRTSVTGRLPSSRASSRRSCSAGSSSPACPASSTSRPSCVRVKTASTSSFGSTLNARRTSRAQAPSATVTGRAEPGEADQRRGEPERGPLGRGHRQVLREHLADDEVEEDDRGEGDDVAERVDQALRDPDRVEDGFEETGHGRLGDGSEGQRADGDAELRGRHHLRQVLQTVQDLLGADAAERFDLAATDGDERELGPDEEAVGQHQEDGEQQLERAHRTPSATSGAAESTATGSVYGSGPGPAATSDSRSEPPARPQPGSGSGPVRTSRTRPAR